MDDFISFVLRHKNWADKTFGINRGVLGRIKHIEKELIELKNNPNGPEEWIDILMLTLDGLGLIGLSPENILEELYSKLEKCKNRKWPDWKSADPNKPIEHIREE